MRRGFRYDVIGNRRGKQWRTNSEEGLGDKAMAWLSNKKTQINIDTAKEKGFSVQEMQIDGANGDKKSMFMTVDKVGHRIILIQPSVSGMYRCALMPESLSGYTLIIGHSNG